MSDFIPKPGTIKIGGLGRKAQKLQALRDKAKPVIVSQGRVAASGGVYEGPARRVSGPTQFDRIVQGDVLVTESTTEAFNILLPLLGAIVTDAGGLLSHSAIVAREYGIPGVVGTRDATDRIVDGTRVRVDGDAGEVTVFA